MKTLRIAVVMFGAFFLSGLLIYTPKDYCWQASTFSRWGE